MSEGEEAHVQVVHHLSVADRFEAVQVVRLDERLSWRAKGILLYLLFCFDDGEAWRPFMLSVSTDGNHALRSGIKELTEAGYLVIAKERMVTQLGFRWVTEVHI